MNDVKRYLFPKIVYVLLNPILFKLQYVTSGQRQIQDFSDQISQKAVKNKTLFPPRHLLYLSHCICLLKYANLLHILCRFHRQKL